MKNVIQKSNKQSTVLVMDNEPDIVKTIAAELEKDGILVVKTYSSEECIALANADNPDLIIMEIKMPEIDGIKVCRRLKKDSNTKDIPVIFVTSKNTAKDKTLAFNAGAIDYITKPFNLSELKVRVNRHLRSKSFHDELRENNNILTAYLKTSTLTNDYFENITRLVDLEQVMEVTQKYFSKIFDDVERFSVWLYDKNREDTGPFVLKVAKEKKMLENVTAIKVEDSPIMKKALDKKKIVVENNFKRSTVYKNKTDKRYSDAKFMCLPLIVEGTVLAIVNLTSKKDNSDFSVLDQQRAISICQILANKIENCQLYKKIETLSIKDSLTQLYNRQFLDGRLEKEFARVLRSREAFTVIMTDIDHFKNVNDTHGHQKGDEVLKGFAQILLANIREADFAARYGGEEFVIALSATDLKGGIKLAEKLRVAIQENIFVIEKKKKRPITASLGVATFQNENYETTGLLLKAADEALYRAKESGRNKTCYAEKFM